MKIYTYEDRQYTDPNFIRTKLSNVSFPADITDKMLMKYGVIITEEPDYTTNIDNLASAKHTRKSQLASAFESVLKGRTEIDLNGNKIYMCFNESDLMKVRGAIDLTEYSNSSIGYLVDSDDNKIENVSVQEMKYVYMSMLNAYNSVYLQYKTKLLEIENASSTTEVEAVSLEFSV